MTLDAPPRPVDKPTDAMTEAELATAIRYHNWRYFSEDAPEISDTQFDLLTRRLKALAPAHPALAELTASGQGAKIRHDTPMLSLDKCYTEEELGGWITDRRTSGEPRRFEGDVVETPKVDGVAASFRYDAMGRLVAAVTRGDGTYGESFLPNARHIDAIPKRIPDGPAEVRGELYMRLSVFESFRADFSNPRNTTAGAIKQKDPRGTARYQLSFFTYDVLQRDFQTEVDKARWVTAQGLEAVESRLIDVSEIQAGYDAWQVRRHEVDYETDGVVYKVNRTDEQRRLGATAHHPRYAVAYKFQGDSGTTTVRDIEWSVSRTGTITPVAIIEPIELSGAMVSRCSLHNLAIVAELGISVGATVTAMRRGGVIPHIEAVTEPGPTPLVIPSACPSCGGATREIGDFLGCAQPLSCPASIRGTLEHFVKAVEVDGFGPKVMGQLLKSGLVNTPADLYRLRALDLVNLERMGDTLARKLVANVDARRTLPLAVFLRALGIDEIGKTVAGVLSENFRSLATLRSTSADALLAIDGIGPSIAASVVRGLSERAELIDQLGEVIDVVDWVPEAVVDGEGPLAMKSVVFTGALATIDRKGAQKQVRALGGQTPSGVTKDLDYLVVGDKGSALLGQGAKSSKQKKAERYVTDGASLQIITETRFLELVAEHIG
ncbi:MAG: NAD-dependent DNA ligase LigA [Myxococcota bacterium]